MSEPQSLVRDGEVPWRRYEAIAHRQVIRPKDLSLCKGIPRKYQGTLHSFATSWYSGLGPTLRGIIDLFLLLLNATSKVHLIVEEIKMVTHANTNKNNVE